MIRNEQQVMHINEKRHDIEELQQQQMKLTAQWNEANSTVHLLKSSITELEHEICTGKKIGHRQSESQAQQFHHVPTEMEWPLWIRQVHLM